MDANQQLGEITPPQPHGPRSSGLMEWHSITITRDHDGRTRAFHNHLDMQTRKLVSERLGDPMGPVPGWPWHVLALLAAAEELEQRHTGEHGV